MSSGQWETVGSKSSKKSKVPVPKGAKHDRNKESNSNYKLSDPIAENATIYSALLMEMMEPEKEKKIVNELPKTPPKYNSTQQKKKKPEKKASSAKLSVENAFASITVEDVNLHLSTLQVLYVDRPITWLKELTSFLNSKLDVTIDDPLFSSKPEGYPFSLFHKGVAKEIIKLIKQCEAQQLDFFFENSLNALVSGMGRNNYGMGYRAILQCLGHESPTTISNNLKKCSDICNNTQNRPPLCLSILWTIGQAGSKNLGVGFQAWSEVMFPLIGNKNFSAFIVDYIEKLVAQTEGIPKKSLIGVKDYFPVLDFVYSKDFNAKGPYHKRMLALMPKIKSLSYGPDPENNLRQYFPSYLRRLEPQCPEPLQEEILQSLLHCLEIDTRCYSIWRQLYTKHFVQSKLLISYIRDHWNNLGPKFPRRLLLETLSVFQVTNNELATNKKKNADIQECIKTTQDLLAHLHKSMAKSKRWLRYGFFFLLVVMFTLFQYDLCLHGSFAASKTGKFMKEYGIIAVSIQVADKLKVFYGEVHMLMEKYLPTICSWCHNTLNPCLESMLSFLTASVCSLWENTQGVRTLVTKNIPLILQKIDDLASEYGPQVQTAATNALVVVSGYLSVIFKATESFFREAVTYYQSSPYATKAVAYGMDILKNVGDLLKHFATQIYSVVQNLMPT